MTMQRLLWLLDYMTQAWTLMVYLNKRMLCSKSACSMRNAQIHPEHLFLLGSSMLRVTLALGSF